jgi:hypothetical protein
MTVTAVRSSLYAPAADPFCTDVFAVLTMPVRSSWQLPENRLQPGNQWLFRK